MTRSRRRLFAFDGTVAVLAGAIAVLLLWQGAEYSGLIARVAEWQFDRSDRYWPTLTVVLLVLVPLGIIALLRLPRFRRERRAAAALPPSEQLRRTLGSETRLLRLATVLAVVALAGAVVCFVVMARIDASGPVRRIDPLNGARPAEGRAALTRRADLTHIAVLTRTILFARQEIFFAPVLEGTGHARYLVELRRVAGPPERWEVPAQGVLRRFPAARELAPVFGEVGISLDKEPFAVLRSVETLRWPWWGAGVQCVAFAVVAALFALLFRRRRNRIETLLAESEQPLA